MRSVLVTGATGFLGRYIVEAAISRGYRVCALARCSSEWLSQVSVRSGLGPLQQLNLADTFAGERFEACFHLASSSDVSASVADPYADLENSVLPTGALFAYLAKHQPGCRVLLASSAAVYGNPARLPINESAPCAPISPYGVHKCLVENLAGQYARLFDLPVVSMRIFSAYGVGLRKQLLWDAVRKGIDALRSKSGEVVFFGTGLESRDFIHATDVAESFLCVAERAPLEPFAVVNVACGVEVQVRDVVGGVLSSISPCLKAKFGSRARSGDPARWLADIAKLRSYGFCPRIDLRASVPEYVMWASGQAKE